MFFDTAHNSESTVLESLRYAFHETARKMVAYVRCLAKARRPRASLIIGESLGLPWPPCSLISIFGFPTSIILFLFFVVTVRSLYGLFPEFLATLLIVTLFRHQRCTTLFPYVF